MSKKLPLPQRYIDKQDYHTKMTIKIIGRKKYKELLDAGIIAVSYDIQKANQKLHTDHIQRLNTTIEVLSTQISRLAHQQRVGHPTHQIR